MDLGTKLYFLSILEVLSNGLSRLMLEAPSHPMYNIFRQTINLLNAVRFLILEPRPSPANAIPSGVAKPQSSQASQVLAASQVGPTRRPVGRPRVHPYPRPSSSFIPPQELNTLGQPFSVPHPLLNNQPPVQPTSAEHVRVREQLADVILRRQLFSPAPQPMHPTSILPHDEEHGPLNLQKEQ